MPQFFVPMIGDNDPEAAFADMAKFAGAAAPALGARIYSIVWRHDGVEWTATVGEKLRGVETIEKKRGRDRTYIEVPRSTDDTVLAIYPGVPWLIMHDNKSKRWNVPILAGEPSSVTTFDPAAGQS